jgi:hypothetical protein
MSTFYCGEFMRIVFLAPLLLSACAGTAQSGPAIYLHPKAKVDIVSSTGCLVAENLTDDVVVPLVNREPGEHTVLDETGRAALKVTPC